MSGKISNNSFKMNNDPNVWVKTASIDTSVKLAGEEAKDRLYEPKHKKKLVRVLTVVAYVFFVSLAAIMLSLYYIFLWKGYPKDFHNKHMSWTTKGPCADMADHGATKETANQFAKQEEVVEPTFESSFDVSSPNPSQDREEPEPAANKGIISNQKFFYSKLMIA